MREGEREAGHQPGGGRLERGRCQRTAEVGLVEPDHKQAGRRGVVAQPSQGKLVRSGEHDQRVRGGMPASRDGRVSNGEIKCRVRRVANLGAGRQIGAGDQVQAGGLRALAVRHIRHDSRFSGNDAGPRREASGARQPGQRSTLRRYR